MFSPVLPSNSAASSTLLLVASLMLAGGIAAADTRSTGNIVTTSVTKLDLAALNASAFGDADDAAH